MPAHSPAQAGVGSGVKSPPKSLEKPGVKAPQRRLTGAKSPANSAANSLAKSSPAKDGGHLSFTNAEKVAAVKQYRDCKSTDGYTFEQLALWFEETYGKQLRRVTWSKWWKQGGDISQRTLDAGRASSQHVRCTIADGVGVALYEWFKVFEGNPLAEITQKDLSMKALQIVENMPPGMKKSYLQIKKKFNASAK